MKYKPISSISNSLEIPFEESFGKSFEDSVSFYTSAKETIISKSKKIVSHSSITEEEKELSDISINRDGIVEEHWASIQKVPSRVIEVSEHFVILECLVDIQNRVYEERSFEKGMFENAIPLINEQLILIKISSRPLKKLIEFVDGTNLIPKSYFDYSNIFEDLKDKRIFKELA